jgi:hypothetical protein
MALEYHVCGREFETIFRPWVQMLFSPVRDLVHSNRLDIEYVQCFLSADVGVYRAIE